MCTEIYGDNQTEIARNSHISCELCIKIHTADSKGKNLGNIDANIRIASHKCNYKRK